MNKTCIAVVGLGYVGLPLVLEFGRIMPTAGFDVSKAKSAFDRSALAQAGFRVWRL